MSGFGQGFITGTLFGLNNNRVTIEKHKEYVRENESKIRIFKEYLDTAKLSFNTAYAGAFDNCKVAILDFDDDPDKRYLYLYKNKTNINAQWENLQFLGGNKYQYENLETIPPVTKKYKAPFNGSKLFLFPNESDNEMVHYSFSSKKKPIKAIIWITFGNTIFKNTKAKPNILDMLNKGEILPEHIKFIV